MIADEHLRARATACSINARSLHTSASAVTVVKVAERWRPEVEPHRKRTLLGQPIRQTCRVIDAWRVQHFSQSNPAGPEQADVPALPRRVAETIEGFDAVEVQDIVFHDESDNDGSPYPNDDGVLPPPRRRVRRSPSPYVDRPLRLRLSAHAGVGHDLLVP